MIRIATDAEWARAHEVVLLVLHEHGEAQRAIAGLTARLSALEELMRVLKRQKAEIAS